MRNPEFRPDQISQDFVRFINRERKHVTGKEPSQTIPISSMFLAHDWCVDPHHNYRGDKPHGFGVVVAGASIRRQSYNDCGILNPYEFMQHVAQSPLTVFPATVYFAAHQHCGELFVSHGAVTLDKQKEIIDSAWSNWQAAYKRLGKYSPADAQRVGLKIKKDVDVTGSAPTIKIDRKGNVEIANMFYLSQHAGQFPLNPEFAARLPDRQIVNSKY